MDKELLVAFAKIVQTGFAVFIFQETVLRAFPMTSEQESAFPALTGEAGTFVTAELLLTLAIEHCCEGLLTDISMALPARGMLLMRRLKLLYNDIKPLPGAWMKLPFARLNEPVCMLMLFTPSLSVSALVFIIDASR